jgi:hypothetical protein
MKFTKHRYGPYHIQYYLLNNIVLSVTLGNFEPYPILVNVNKVKPYRYVEHVTTQPIAHTTINQDVNDAIESWEI